MFGCARRGTKRRHCSGHCRTMRSGIVARGATKRIERRQHDDALSPRRKLPTLQPFTQALVSMMFARAAFEHRVSDLMEVITGVKGFGERSENPWKVDDRPKRMKRLIKEYRHGGLPETDAIVDCLKRSISFCRTRNLLAHGVWWRFPAFQMENPTKASTATLRTIIAIAATSMMESCNAPVSSAVERDVDLDHAPSGRWSEFRGQRAELTLRKFEQPRWL